MKEATLEVDGVVVLRFAIANGFRNIQNLVQKLKSKRCPYDYVEVMACPSGKLFLFLFSILISKSISNILINSIYKYIDLLCYTLSYMS